MKRVRTLSGIGADGAHRLVAVAFDEALEEYRCKVTQDGERRKAADYFTDDREDALDTARAIIAAEHAR